ncbi:MAG: SPOR domain-containing protein [Gammaproteobacteria bacterium]|nr:SPOR domain-containing protein [Gammaproteobacteria bacterium]
MPNNVVQKIDKPEVSVVASPDAEANLFNGQKKPAPFLHDPSLFQDAPPVYYLKTDALASLMAHVQNAFSDHGPMQVIIAEHGRGKSAFIRQLISEAAAGRWQLCYIHADYQLGVDHIIDALGQVFSDQERGDFESLVNGLIRYDANQPSPLVIVDDAQNISSYGLETLATIKRTVTEQGGNIDILLCASPALRKNIASYGMSAFKDRWFEVHPLPRFTEEDTLAYLNERFENSAETEFTPSQLQIINRRGYGVPACINYHAELALGRQVSDERLRLAHQQMLKRQKKMPYFIGGGVAALLLLVTSIFMLANSESEPLVGHMAIATLPTSTDFPVSAKQTVAVANVVEQPPVTKREVKAPVVVKTEEKPEIKPVAKPEPKSKSKPKPAPEPLPDVVTKVVSEPVLIPVIVDKPAPPLTEVVKPVSAEKPAPVVEKRESARPVVATPAKVVKASSDGAIPGVAWLTAQPEDYYTIQLAGSPDEKSIIRYITRSSLDGELAYVLLERNNRSSWYVVLHGSFESRAEAKRIIEFFPPELRKNKPWIRQFSKLKNRLDESQISDR